MMNRKILLSLIAIFLSFLIVFIIYPKNIGDKIVLGQTCALTGPSGELGSGVAKGANAYFSFINEKGGVDGKKITLITLDDKYEPDLASKNIDKLNQQRDLFALFGVLGTPTAKAALKKAIYYDLPFIAPITGAGFLREPDNKNIINFRVSYEVETEVLIDYLITEKNITKVAILYQFDSFGLEGLRGTQKALKKYNLDLVSEGTYTRNTLSIGNALYEIKKGNPEAIVMIGAYKPVSFFIKRARNSNMNSVIFANLSFVGSYPLAENLNYDMKNVIISQVIPPPDSDNWSAMEYRDIFKRYFPNDNFSYTSYEGFLAAKIFVESLKIVNKPINKESLLRELSIRNFNTLDDFDKLNAGKKSVYITEFVNGGFKVISKIFR